jgi:hypothetical protein
MTIELAKPHLYRNVFERVKGWMMSPLYSGKRAYWHNDQLFTETHQVIREMPLDIPYVLEGIWEGENFYVYDLVLEDVPFVERLHQLEKLKNIKVVPYVILTDEEEMHRMCEKWNNSVLLRKPHAMYIHGRSHAVLKYTPQVETGQVVQIQKNKLVCVLESGTQCLVQGTVQGNKVQVRFNGKSPRGAPFYPVLQVLV